MFIDIPNESSRLNFLSTSISNEVAIIWNKMNNSKNELSHSVLRVFDSFVFETTSLIRFIREHF